VKQDFIFAAEGNQNDDRGLFITFPRIRNIDIDVSTMDTATSIFFVMMGDFWK
jgi:hypothetical protein